MRWILCVGIACLWQSVWGASGALSMRLSALVQEYGAYQRSGQAQPFRSTDVGLKVWQGKVLVTITVEGSVEALLPRLQALGMVNLTSFANAVSGWVPIERLPDLEFLPAIVQIRPALLRKNAFGKGPNSVVSQGDLALQADRIRKQFGVDGSRVAVGVLSDSFDCLNGYEEDVAFKELPANVEVLSDLSREVDEEQGGPSECEALGGNDEGRAMLQIIHDLAPGARLLFHTAFRGEAEFAAGILALANAGAKVIVDDVGYFSEPIYQDGMIAQAIEQVQARGVAYLTAAGNSGRLGYEAAFRPAWVRLSGEVAHDFNPDLNIEDFYQAIEIPQGAEITIVLQWNQPFRTGSKAKGAASDSDLDLILFDEKLARVVAISREANLDRDPLEVLTFVNDTDQTRFQLYIAHRAGVFPERIAYWINGPSPSWPAERGPAPHNCLLENSVGGLGAGQSSDPQAPAVKILEYTSPSNGSTIVGHANARGALTIGAISYRETPFFGVCTQMARIEPFSSVGGIPVYFAADGAPLPDAPEIRQKPDLIAADEVNTSFFPTREGADSDGDGLPNFSGTSAAAPHAAAIAALLFDYAPKLTVNQLYDALRRSARDLDDPGTAGFDYGFDFASGFGLLDASLAFTALETDGLFLSLAPGPTEVLAGQEILYQLTVTNLSALPFLDVAVRGEIPGATRITGLDGCPRVDVGRSACVIGNLPPGGRHRIDLRLKVVDGRVGAIEPVFTLMVGDMSLADTPGGLIAPRTRVARPLGDFNQDGCVDVSDRGRLLAALRWPVGVDPAFDLNADGKVDLEDLKDLVRRYTYPAGQPC
ncbi:hypothetical protein JCM13664_08360 [Methylothermus subterraneus]